MLIRMSERNTQYLLRKLAADDHIAIHLRASPRKTNLYQVLRPWCKDCAEPVIEGATGYPGNGAKAFAPDPQTDPKPEKRENTRAREEERKPQVTKVTEAEISSWLTPGSALWYFVQGLTSPGEEGEAALQGNGHHNKDGKALDNGTPCRL
jgi:hypothetical protein